MRQHIQAVVLYQWWWSQPWPWNQSVINIFMVVWKEKGFEFRKNHRNYPVESGPSSNWDGWRTSILDKMQMPSLQMKEKSLKNRSVLKLYGSVAHQSEPFTLQQCCSTESVKKPHTSRQQTLIKSGCAGSRQKSQWWAPKTPVLQMKGDEMNIKQEIM